MELTIANKSKIVPLHDHVLVERVDGESKTKGGLYIPDNAKEKPSEGIVVEAGPGKFEYGEVRPLQVKKGDRVLFGKYNGSDVVVGETSYLLLREEEILATIENSEEHV